MPKRDFDSFNGSHIEHTDSTDNIIDSSVNKNVSYLKSLNNTSRFNKKSKLLINSTDSLNMDVSISRKSTSDGDYSMDQEGFHDFNSSKVDNSDFKDVIEPADQNKTELSNNLSLNQFNNHQQAPVVSFVQKSNVSNKHLETNSAGYSNSYDQEYEGIDDHVKDKLTPSRKADYVHTLLSGRSTLDNSINLLSKMTSEGENNTQPSSRDPEKIEPLPSVNEQIGRFDSIASTQSNDYNAENNEEPDTQQFITPESKDGVSVDDSEHNYQEFERSNDLSDINNDSYEEVDDDLDYSVESNVNESDDLKDDPELDKFLNMYKRLYNNHLSVNRTENEKLRVVVRCKPSPGINKVIECEKSCIKLLKPGDENSVFKSQRPSVFEFNFDYIVKEDETTEQLYNVSCTDLVQKILSGTSVTVFAYGSTGSGKTYTITGNENSRGLVYLMLSDLFSNNEICNHELYLSYFEVYNENVYDLLVESERNLRLQEVDRVVFVKGLTKVKVDSYEEFIKAFEIGNRNRKVFTTNANRSSSRSHAILQIQTGATCKLTLIDLAGSERMKITENTGDRLKESSYINQSLLALINCINTLSKNSKCLRKMELMKNMGQDDMMYYSRVKYRDSKLTHLLKNSLSSNCFILMIAHLNPDSMFYQDSYNTIKYALRAKNVEITQITTKGQSGKEVIKKFTKELLFLVNLMKNRMNEKQLEQVKDDMCKLNLIGQPIFKYLVE